MNILDWFKNGLAAVPHKIKVLAEKALEISKKVQAFIEGKELQAITDAIPGDWDDSLKAKADSWLTNIQATLQWIDDNIKEPEHVVLMKHALLQKTQSHITALQDGNDKQESEYDKASQLVYSK